MSLVTNWGYTLTEMDSLDGILTEDEFNTFTANKYAGDVRISVEASAVCASIRNYCGWHISPPAVCRFEEYLLHGNGRVKRTGRDLSVQLPAAFVTGVSSVMVGGTEHSDYAFEANGLLHLFDVDFSSVSRKTKVTVLYTAGIPDGGLGIIKELAAHRITHALAVPSGVTSEASGGISVTYNSAWTASTLAASFSDNDKEAMQPYRVQGVF